MILNSTYILSNMYSLACTTQAQELALRFVSGQGFNCRRTLHKIGIIRKCIMASFRMITWIIGNDDKQHAYLPPAKNRAIKADDEFRIKHKTEKKKQENRNKNFDF